MFVTVSENFSDGGACRELKPEQIGYNVLFTLIFSDHKLVKNIDTKDADLTLPFLSSHEAILSCVSYFPRTHSLMQKERICQSCLCNNI